MSRLTRDGTAETVSRDQIIRHERGQGDINFPCVQLTTSRVGNLTRLIHTIAICVTIHTYCLYYNYYKAMIVLSVYRNISTQHTVLMYV